MIRRTLQWLGLGHLLTNLESDEIMRAIRHRSAFRTMQLTVMLCFIVSAVIRIWFQELMQVTITLVIVALFMMITNDLINWYRGVDLAEGELRDREPVTAHQTTRSFFLSSSSSMLQQHDRYVIRSCNARQHGPCGICNTSHKMGRHYRH